MIYRRIQQLLRYGMEQGLLEKEDEIFTRNRLLAFFNLNEWKEPEEPEEPEGVLGEGPESDLEAILKDMLDYAWEQGILKENSVVYRDLLDTKIMALLLARPSEIIRTFREKYEISPEEATGYYYHFCRASDYIRTYRVKKDLRWKVDSEYGEIDITINLSKPEKDPKAIAAAKMLPVSGYPKCLLCMENEGYAGRVNHPARDNHRIIPVKLQGEDWGFQYSPYVYYNEHCIVLSGKHAPMKIDRSTFEKLFDFVDFLPHYFVGSNADLPIVGGSILTHEHFQGGNYEFAMNRAKIEKYFQVEGYEDVSCGILHWPLSVIRLQGADRGQIVRLADHILKLWRGYTDEEAFIFACGDHEPAESTADGRTDEKRPMAHGTYPANSTADRQADGEQGEPHNTITPIARKRKEIYELDLTLRNNITTREHPLGVFHPHEEYHNIKKENIGLIEVMGLAVLPSRLSEEFRLIADAILQGKDIAEDGRIAHHSRWAARFLERCQGMDREQIMETLMEETGQTFVKVLEDAGVYKCTPEGRKYFDRFIREIQNSASV